MIYLDYAANTPVDDRVIDEFVRATKKYIANPNSSHLLGKEASIEIDECSNYLAHYFKCDSKGIIYTSGSSESNNLVIKGIASKYIGENKNIIISSLEHSSVVAPCNYLTSLGFDVNVISVGKDGKKVTINDDGVTCCNADGTVKKHQFDTKMAVIGAIEATLFTLAAVAYVVTSAILGWWHIMWIVFFIPEIICSIARAIVKRNANHFNMAFTAIFTFFLVCFTLPVALGTYGNPMLWHPMWVVFLAIPAYHSVVGAINKVLGKEEEKDEDEDDDPEDPDDKD